jgi:flagellar hook protein FlgE
MTGFGWFQSSALGMQGQSHALEVISGNIANMTTAGFKRLDTEFKTVLSRTWESTSTPYPLSTHSDIGGVAPVDFARIADQGEIKSTGRALDLAIGGRGFFVLNSELGGGGTTRFTRDGGFDIAAGAPVAVADPNGGTITGNEGYLVDANGHFLQGWAADPTGTVIPSAGTAAIRVDPFAHGDVGAATTAVSLTANLPAGLAAGASRNYRLQVYDGNAGSRGLDLVFEKLPAANTWGVRVAGEPGDAVTVTPPDPGGGAGDGEPLAFDPFGRPTAPLAYTVAVAHADGAATAFTLDVADLSQFAADFSVTDVAQDGRPQGDLEAIAFDDEGYVVGRFANGASRPLYRLALANFVNPDGLTPMAGNLYAEGERSGPPTLGVVGEAGLGTVSPESLELSNVDLADEFSRMIVTQNAYNSSATAFRTVDEMTEAARDLKA